MHAKPHSRRQAIESGKTGGEMGLLLAIPSSMVGACAVRVQLTHACMQTSPYSTLPHIKQSRTHGTPWSNSTILRCTVWYCLHCRYPHPLCVFSAWSLRVFAAAKTSELRSQYRPRVKRKKFLQNLSIVRRFGFGMIVFCGKTPHVCIIPPSEYFHLIQWVCITA